VKSPNDPKLSHGHQRPSSECNVDYDISYSQPKSQWAVVGSSAVLGGEIKSQLIATTTAPKHNAKTRWNWNLHMALNAA
jgi:hypothetical protein